MNRKILITIAILMIVGILWFVFNRTNNNSLIGPQLLKTFTKPTPSPSETPVPPNSPRTFQFDSSTDLKAELEKVNPQVLDSDFNE